MSKASEIGLDNAFRIASELVYATIAYNETVLADDGLLPFRNEETYRARRESYDYMVQVQNELQALCLLLAKEPA